MSIDRDREELPVQDFSTVQPTRKKTQRRRFWQIFALAGAIVVVALYLIIPLVIFLGIARDLLTQLLGALLLLMIAEFVIVSILLKTARSMKPISGKMRAALLNSRETDNVPFDIVADAETVGIPVQRRKDMTRVKSQSEKGRQSVSGQPSRSQPLGKVPQRSWDEER